MKHLRQYIRRVLLEGSRNHIDINNLVKCFREHLLETFDFKDSGPGHLNCAWVTFYFIQWAQTQGVPRNMLKAMYIVEPKPETVGKLKALGILGSHYPLEGEAHIMPAIGSILIDPSYRQFDASGPHTKITDYRNWKSVYGKFGYGLEHGGSDDPFYKGVDHKFGSLEEVQSWASWMPDMSTYRPVEKL